MKVVWNVQVRPLRCSRMVRAVSRLVPARSSSFTDEAQARLAFTPGGSSKALLSGTDTVLEGALAVGCGCGFGCGCGTAVGVAVAAAVGAGVAVALGAGPATLYDA